MKWNRGIALPTVLLMISVLVVIVTAMLILGSGNLSGAYQQVQTDQALAAAEAGAWDAALNLSLSSSWVPATGNTTLASSHEQFSVVLFPAGSSTPQGVVVPAGLVYVLSTGASPGGKTRQVGFMVKTGVGALNYAALTANGITVKGGSHIDSVDPLTGLALTAPASIAVDSSSSLITLLQGC